MDRCTSAAVTAGSVVTSVLAKVRSVLAYFRWRRNKAGARRTAAVQGRCRSPSSLSHGPKQFQPLNTWLATSHACVVPTRNTVRVASIEMAVDRMLWAWLSHALARLALGPSRCQTGDSHRLGTGAASVCCGPGKADTAPGVRVCRRMCAS